MTRYALLLVVVGCSGDPDPAGKKPPGADSGDPPTTTTQPSDTADTHEPTITWEQPAFAEPPVAADLDADDGVLHVSLTPAPNTFDIVDWQTRLIIPVEGHSYEGSHPAPTLRANVGDVVRVDVQNDLDDPTTIHWHGLAVPFEMDGVTWMRDPIYPGDRFTYEFAVQKPGTYWYHPHFDTAAQVDRGLYGALVVADPDDPPVDRELVLLLDDWREDQSIPVDADHVHGAHGAEGVWTVNGLVRPVLNVTAGERIRLRLINTSNQGYLWLGGGAAPLTVVGRDQGLLPSIESVDRELLAPGDRVDLLWTPGTDAPAPALEDWPYSLHGGAAMGDAVPLLDVVVDGDDPAATTTDWPETARPPTPDTVAPAFTYTFQGSAHTDDWMINGERFPDITVQQLAEGETVVFEVRNLSATEHPFHLHGLHMELLARDGVAPAQYSDVDTVNLGLYETLRLRTTADNLGAWMAHCHILPHGDGGMMTVLEVVE